MEEQELSGGDLLHIMAHPVTGVYVNEEAIVCYERHNAPPLALNVLSPARSRRAARDRAQAALAYAPEVNGVQLFDVTISETAQVGLTYRELILQTRAAIEQSYELEKVLNDKRLQKAKKYKLI